MLVIWGFIILLCVPCTHLKFSSINSFKNLTTAIQVRDDEGLNEESSSKVRQDEMSLTATQVTGG